MSTKHTPEPWEVRHPHDVENMKFIYSQSQNSLVFTIGNTEWGRANAARIVECVNACAGMGDPAATIRTMRYELDRFRNGLADSGSREISELKAQRDALRDALEGIVNYVTIDFAEKWGFGPQRMKVSEVYDWVKWGRPNAPTDPPPSNGDAQEGGPGE